MGRKTFWMVVGIGVPYFKHDSENNARAEAERLARLNPGQEFTVLESIATVVKSDVNWIPHGECGDVPF